MIRRSLFHAWRLSALTLLLIAILVTLARFGLPWVQTQRQAMLDALLDGTSLQADVRSLGVSWSEYGPAITLHDLAVSPRQHQGWALSIRDAEIRIRPWHSLMARRWELGGLRFAEVHLRVDSQWIEQQQGDSSAASADWQPLATLLLGQFQHFTLEDSDIKLRTPMGELTRLQIVNLSWSNRGLRHSGVGELAFSHPGVRSHLQLIADFHGRADTPAALDGSLFLQSSARSDASDVQPALQGELDFRFWLKRQARAWQLAQLQLGENALSWQRDGQTHSVAARGGLLQWKKLAQGWQLSSQGLEVRDEHQGWQPWQLQLDMQDQHLSGELDPINLAAVTPALVLLSGTQGELGQALQQLQPKGRVDDIRVQHRLGSDDWQLEARLQRVGWQRWGMLPGVQQMDGLLALSPAGGQLQLALGPQTLRVGPYFPADIPLTSLDAALALQKRRDGWVLMAQGVQLRTPALSVNSDVRLTLPTTAAPALYLLSDIDLHDAGQAWRYYPRLAMGQRLTDYLRSALQQGSVDGAVLLWNGPLDAFPYHDGGGRFQVQVPLRNARFQFDPQWQPLTDLSLDLLFQNDTLAMRSTAATLGQAKSNYIDAWFPALAEDARLYINADVQGEAAAVQQYLIHSGVADSVGSAMQALPLRHPLQGAVQLVIPLDGSPVDLLGHVDFAGNELTVRDLGLSLSRLDGRLEFTQQETRFKGLTAAWQGQPVRLDYEGRQQGDSYLVDLQMDGIWSSAAATLPAGWQPVVQGRTPWQGKLQLTLQPQGYRYQGQWQSSLRGLALALPAPYTKAASDARPFRLSARGDQNASQLQAEWQPGWRWQGDWLPAKQMFSRFWLGNQQLEPTGQTWAPFHLQLNFPELDADAWQAWWQRIQAADASASTSSSQLLSSLPVQRSWQLVVPKFRWQQQSWDKLTLSGRQDPQQQEWKLLANQVTASARRQGTQPWSLDLVYLDWHPDDKTAAAAPAPMPSRAEQLSTLAAIPPFNLTCQRCVLGKQQLGRLEMQVRPTATGLKVDNLLLQQGNNKVSGQGAWQLTAGASQSQLQLNGQIASLETWLQALDYPLGFSGTPASFDSQLTWQGPLYRFDKPSLAGKLRFESGEGMLRNMGSTGTRLLSVFSLHAVMRRLSLDFSDLLEKGLFFRRIRFHSQIDNGVIHSDDFLLEADAGDIKAKGTLDLNSQKIDYRISFRPQFANELSLATAVAVTPVTGIYVLAASKLLSPVLDVITEIRFAVGGTLGAPEVIETGRDTRPAEGKK